MSGPLRPVLVAEDEESDALILQRVFRRAGVENPVVIVRDGQAAVDALGGGGPLPALLLLDLKMPRMNGFEVLRWLGTRDDLASVPAVVLSSSAHQSDIDKALALGARDYHTKPQDLARFVQLVKDLKSRWLC